MKVVELDDVKNDESRREKERIIARMHKAEKNFFGRSPLSKVLENTMSQTSKIRMMETEVDLLQSAQSIDRELKHRMNKSVYIKRDASQVQQHNLLDSILGDIKHLRNTLDTTLEKHIEKDGQRFPKSLSGAAPVSLSQHKMTQASILQSSSFAESVFNTLDYRQDAKLLAVDTSQSFIRSSMAKQNSPRMSMRKMVPQSQLNMAQDPEAAAEDEEMPMRLLF